jgi:hypothetical protein
MKNTFTLEGNKISAVSHIKASKEHQCKCGHAFSFTVDWPEGLVQEGSIEIMGVQCPVCQQAVKLPLARHWVEDFQLCSRPLD